MKRWLAILVFLEVALFVPGAWAKPAEEGTTARLRRAQSLRESARANLDAAEGEYRAVLRQDADNLEAERGLARILRDRGAAEQALPYLRDVAKRSDAAVDYARLGWGLYRTGRWAEAAEAFREARQRGRNDAET